MYLVLSVGRFQDCSRQDIANRTRREPRANTGGIAIAKLRSWLRTDCPEKDELSRVHFSLLASFCPFLREGTKE